MKTMRQSLWLCTCVTLLAARAASAQVPAPAAEKCFVNMNFGRQLAARTIGNSATSIVYGETASLTSTQPVNKGNLIDLAGGYRVWRNLYAGVGVSGFTDSQDAEFTASVPDPLYFDRPKKITGTATGLSRTELAINPNVTLAMPLSDKFVVAIGVGASIIKVKQELLGGFTVTAGTQNVVPFTVEEKGTAKGAYASVDLIYNLASRYGVGGFVRYAGGKVDLDSAADHNVGGMQAGGGIRLRF